ncbi:hypothetical protein GCM10010472_66770 [Pseudonocardia halophobica]|uniref:Uncharacterized protein n=1 Tax=Pseudonocardia halophobica TaxID=29401 RepID=A0A9W6P169_9PSEU|nr:hypothetical protein GCM10017577_71010 [Pseudonocardia halophobica]
MLLLRRSDRAERRTAVRVVSVSPGGRRVAAFTGAVPFGAPFATAAVGLPPNDRSGRVWGASVWTSVLSGGVRVDRPLWAELV